MTSDTPRKSQNLSSVSASPKAYVDVRGVSKVFKGRDRDVEALNDIDLRLEAGQFVSLLGPSGCGKSTLLAVVAGLELPTKGSVSIDGTEVHRPYTKAGVVFQKDLLLEWRTSLSNILLQFEMRGLNPKPHRKKAHELLELVGMEDFADKHPHELSGGMRQRIAICRALIHDPQLLLMDEPFGALDAITRDRLNLDLARITSIGEKSVLFVTHSIEEAVFLSDRVVVMSPRPGRIIADITIGLPRPRDLAVQDTNAFVDAVRELRALLAEEGNYGNVA